MTNFPQRSQLPSPKVLYKPNKKGNTDFFEHLSLTTKEKQALRSQIGMMAITHVLDSTTTNIPAGEAVKQLVVLEVTLKEEPDVTLFQALDQRLGFYLIFKLIQKNGNVSYLINYKEPIKTNQNGVLYKIIRNFESSEEITLDYGVSTLDVLYDQIVKEVAKDELSSDQTEDVRLAIVKKQEQEKLEKKAAQLKKKMFAAKAMRQQMSYRKDYQETLAALKKLTEHVENKGRL